jgi:hypothetical protein
MTASPSLSPGRPAVWPFVAPGRPASNSAEAGLEVMDVTDGHHDPGQIGRRAWSPQADVVLGDEGRRKGLEEGDETLQRFPCRHGSAPQDDRTWRRWARCASAYEFRPHRTPPTLADCPRLGTVAKAVNTYEEKSTMTLVWHVLLQVFG